MITFNESKIKYETDGDEETEGTNYAKLLKNRTQGLTF